MDTTPCNDVSVNFWDDITPNFLTQALRTQMNGLTESLNAQISAAVGRANARDNRKPAVCNLVSKPILCPSKDPQLTRTFRSTLMSLLPLIPTATAISASRSPTLIPATQMNSAGSKKIGSLTAVTPGPATQWLFNGRHGRTTNSP